MAHRPDTEYQFNIEDARWRTWHDWLAHHGRAIMDHAIEKGLGDAGTLHTGETIDSANLEINILLLGDGQIRDINHQHRDKNEPTNVLSFPQFDSMEELIASFDQHGMDTQKKPLILGDIVLSYETIAKQARMASKTMQEHLAHMLVHGILHLLGHDHKFDDEARVMEKLECDILNAFDIKSPYTMSGSVAY